VSASSLGGFDAVGGDFDASGFERALGAWCEPYALRCSKPFLAKWYNEKRSGLGGSTQIIEGPESAICFALYSVPGFLEVVADHYRRRRPAADSAESETSTFVDSTTDEILEKLRASVAPALDAVVVNIEAGPPYYHVQCIGDVAGIDQHVAAEHIEGEDAAQWREELSDALEDSRDTKMWGTDPATLRKIFGVNVHPVWGGWYAYRALVVLRGASVENLPRPEPLKFLSQEDARRILKEYNLNAPECRWRDLMAQGHPPEKQYTTDEYFFFTEVSDKKRLRWLELRAAQLDREAGLGLRVPCLSR